MSSHTSVKKCLLFLIQQIKKISTAKMPTILWLLMLLVAACTIVVNGEN
jgi:hypothetical protein